MNSRDGANQESGKVEKLRSGKVSVKLRSGKYAVAVAAVVLAAIASRASAQIPAPGVIAFTGARVIDGTGAAPIEQATIVVTNGR